MTDYKKTLEEFEDGSNTKTYSRSGILKLNNAYFNDPEYKSHRVVPDGDGGFTEEEVSPAAEFRSGLKDLVKRTYGIDTGEIGKLDNVDLPRKVTDPMLDGVTFVQKDYLSSGRALKLPMTSTTETSMSVYVKKAPEVSFDTKRIEKDGDAWVSVPTGETVTHKERDVISVSNKVPGWLSEKKKK